MTELDKKVLKVAEEICWLYGSKIGDQICQDWEGDTHPFTDEEIALMNLEYEKENQCTETPEDLNPAPEDGMMMSYYIACQLERILKGLNSD